jgi:hypothetical protein
MLHDLKTVLMAERSGHICPASGHRSSVSVVQEGSCSVHAAGGFDVIDARFCAVNVKLTIGLGIAGKWVLSDH